MVAYFSQSFPVAFLTTDLVRYFATRESLLFALFASTHTLTSLSSVPPVSSAPIPSLLTGLFLFPILKGMFRMSLALHMLMIDISLCVS